MSTETQPWRTLVRKNPGGIPWGPAAIHLCPVPDCLDIWESEPTCEHSPPPCGHADQISGCGGCDPGAIEFVLKDAWESAPGRTDNNYDSPWDIHDGVMRPFDPGRDLTATENPAHRPTSTEEK